jgi:hypothetical protein
LEVARRDCQQPTSSWTLHLLRCSRKMIGYAPGHSS